MVTNPILTTEDNGNKNDFIADERLYLDKSGSVVGDDDPNKNELLVAKGGRLSADIAAKYGLPRQKKTKGPNVAKPVNSSVDDSPAKPAKAKADDDKADKAEKVKTK